VAVAEITPLTIGVKARCSDGDCGRVTRVVIDPIDDKVTHLLVEPEHREGLGRLVPTRLVHTGTDHVDLACTRAEFDHLEVAEQVRFLPGSEGYPGYDPEQMLIWPFYGGNTTVPVTVDSLPRGEVSVARDEDVHASDGRIGKVEGLVVDSRNQHVTHVLLQEGHLFGRKEVAIPVSVVTGVDEAGIRVSLSKQEIEALPAVDVRHPLT
jgi:sporulation protein YlmC with PRC-barrel domain